MMITIRNERGIALVTSMLFTLLALGIILALLYMISQGTKLSAANKRYKNALEASYGGVDVFTQEIIPQIIQNTNPTSYTAILVGGAPPTTPDLNCFNIKLNNTPANWGACSSTVDPTDTYDAKFQLKGQDANSNFDVYAKIVDTKPGNSDMSGIEYLDSGSGVAYGASGVNPQHLPATYRIEVRGQKSANPLEKGNLSVLYAY